VQQAFAIGICASALRIVLQKVTLLTYGLSRSVLVAAIMTLTAKLTSQVTY